MSDIATERIEAAAKAMWANDRTWETIDPTNRAIQISFATVALAAADAVSPQPEQVGWWNEGMFLYMDEQGPVKADPEHWKPVVVHHG